LPPGANDLFAQGITLDGVLHYLTSASQVRYVRATQYIYPSSQGGAQTCNASTGGPTPYLLSTYVQVPISTMGLSPPFKIAP
jgi:hypothetical protein